MKCVDVLLPLHVEQLYSYLVPPSLAERVSAGCRVIVPFGKSKVYTGIVVEVSEKPASETLKEIVEVLDEQPFASDKQLDLWRWIASYYACFAGDVLRAALPSGLRWDQDEPFSPVTERYIRCSTPLYEGKLTPKQSRLLAVLSEPDRVGEGIARKELLKMDDASDAVLSGLLKKGAAEAYDRAVPPRIKFEPSRQTEPLPVLTDSQSSVFEILKKSVSQRKTALLHGVAYSGKREVCARLIGEALQNGKQVLYLIPDAKAAAFSVARLNRYFGRCVAVYHSKISQRDKLNLWSCLSGGNREPLLVVGVHSALFLPFSNLGLIVVADEHDDGYKHGASSPRYHARNVALMLGASHNAGVVLSSAAPSIESYNHAVLGKYTLAVLDRRYGTAPLPAIHIENSVELRRKKIQKGLFSPLLHEKMEQAFAAGEQVLLFHNRKHYARVLECEACGWTPACERCRVALPYTKRHHSLVCSYCGGCCPLPSACADCGGKVHLKGVGTEQIEDELQARFPSLRIARVDGDTVSNERQFLATIDSFNKGDIDLIVGTQLIVGNIDFSQVRVVGVINGDLLLNVPDFRAHEKAFQTFTQLAGYAGRDGKASDVVIQAGQACLPLMQALKEYDYRQMYTLQCAEREQYAYPPFTRLIRVLLSGANSAALFAIGQDYSCLLASKLGDRVSGPVEEGEYYASSIAFLLKIEASASYLSVRAVLNEIYSRACAEIDGFKKLKVVYDVDPA